MRLWFWYAWPAVLFTLFSLPDILDKTWIVLERRIPLLRSFFPTSVKAAGPLLLVACSFYWGIEWTRTDPGDFRLRNLLIARQLNSETGDGTLIAMGDQAGSFAWFFHGRVLQLEGLVGDGGMADAIESGHLREYVGMRSPDYLLSCTGPEGLQDYGSGDCCTPTGLRAHHRRIRSL